MIKSFHSGCLIIFIFLQFGILRTSHAQGRFQRIDSIAVAENGQLLRNAWSGGLNFPLYASIDLDGDGRLDMIAYDRHNNRMNCFRNNGSPSLDAWDFAPQFKSSFPPINRWALTYDYNCDGKMDLFTVSPNYPSCIACYRNDYTAAGGLQFTLMDPELDETFSTSVFPIFASGVLVPAFDDVDADGDMDILGFNSFPDGRIILHKNQSMETYGVCDSLKFDYANACWGNFALFIGGANSVGCFNCPCRVSSNPFVSEPEPAFSTYELTKRDDTVSSIFSIDIDGDTTRDLLVGDISSLNSLLVHNGGSPNVAGMDSQDLNYPSSDIPAIFNGFHSHAYMDLNNDGLKDLIVSPAEYENKAGMWVYENTGTASSPVFHLVTTTFLQDGMLDVGENAAPVPFDYDSDGRMDLVIGGAVYDTATSAYRTSLFLYRNSGTAADPAYYLVNDDVAGISALALNSTIYPAFGDLDNDQDADMLLGTEDGKLQYFVNTAGPGNPSNFQLAAANYMGIDVGNNCTPQLVDLNRDGVLDLVAGEKNGFVNFYKNSGTSSTAFFTSVPTEDTLGDIVLQITGFTDGYTVPFFYDSAGVYRLAVSNMGGNVYFYGNIDGNLYGTFSLLDSLYDKAESSRIRFDVTVSGSDINADGLCDLVIGQAAGGAEVWYQQDLNSNVHSPVPASASFIAYPNPAKDHITVNLNEQAVVGGGELRLYDLSGRVLLCIQANTPVIDIPVADLAEGVYLLQLAGSPASAIQKVRVMR